MKLKDGIKPWLENIVRPILTGSKYDECCKCVEWIIAELGDRDTKEISLNTMVHFMNKLKGEKHLQMGFVETIEDVLEEFLDYVDKVEKEEWHDAESENNKNKYAEKERGIMDNEDMKKESPGKEELETGWNYQLNKQLCAIAKLLRSCIHEIKKTTFLFKGQICYDLQQTADFHTLLCTVRGRFSNEAENGIETCRKYLIEASDRLDDFIESNSYINDNCDAMINAIYGKEISSVESEIDKRKEILHEKGRIGLRKKDGSWDIENCRWTFEDRLLFHIGDYSHENPQD